MQKYSISDKSPRKRKPTDFYLSQPDATIQSIMQSDENISTEDNIQNKFYSYYNSAKLCAEGALVNLIGVVGCSEEDIKVFWDIVCDQSMQSVCVKLVETIVPKLVYKKDGGVGFFAKKINFVTATRMKESSFQNLQHTMNLFSYVKFPVIIAVRGTLACYHHVVVVWKGVVINFESKYTYPLTNESLTQICRKTPLFLGLGLSLIS